MHPLRNYRRARGLTITDLARLSGVSARELGNAESGGQPLTRTQTDQVARVLNLTTQDLVASRHRSLPSTLLWQGLMIMIIVIAILLLLVTLFPDRFNASATNQANVQPAYAAIRPTESLAQPVAVAAQQAAPQPQPAAVAAFVAGIPEQDPPRQQGEPHACPLLAEPQRVVITQGFNEGTHTPAALAGAIDLGIDTDGDGVTEPQATAGTVILATHSGTAAVFLNSWPGGNVIRITNAETGWSTLYAHLDLVAVVDGASVTAGTPLGTVGSTGMSSGPHLHYEIRYGDTNIDPAPFVPCWRQ